MKDEPASVSGRLAAAADLAEQGFLAAGQSLETAIGVLDRLTRRFSEYVADLTGDVLNETRQDLATAGQQVTALTEARRADEAARNQLTDIVAVAGLRVAALQPITREVENLSL